MLVKSVVKSAWRVGARVRRGKVCAALRATGSPVAEGVATALDRSLRSVMDDDEGAWARRIEAMRLELGRSTRLLTVADHGAGSKRSAAVRPTGPGATRSVTVAQACRASKPPFWGRLLLGLARAVRPAAALELGTCVGISAAYQAAGLELNGSGRLVTLEGAEELAEVARETLRRLGLDRATVVTGRFQDTLADVLDRHGPIDHAFIDGHHDEQATVGYFRMLVPHLSPAAVLVFDDISWSPGMRRAWRTIAASEPISVALDLRSVGVCVVDPAIERSQHLKLALV